MFARDTLLVNACSTHSERSRTDSRAQKNLGTLEFWILLYILNAVQSDTETTHGQEAKKESGEETPTEKEKSFATQKEESSP